MEKPLHRACDRFTVVHRLEKRQLRLDSCHYQPIDQDGALQASQSHYQCSRTSRSNHRRDGTISWPPKLHHQ